MEDKRMRRFEKVTFIIIGMVIMAIISTTAIPVMAALAQKQITVSTGVNIYVDDVKLNPVDANGKPVEVFIHNGTTYLPVRAVSQALGKPVSWEGKTNSVYIGKHDASVIQILDQFDNIAIQWEDKALERMIRNYLGNIKDPIYQEDLDFINTIEIWGSDYIYINGKDANGRGRDADAWFDDAGFVLGGDKRITKRGDIDTLSDLQYFKNIVNVDINFNHVKDISVFSKLPKVKSVFLCVNDITDISVFKNMTQLECLWLNYNNISDISSLIKLTNLVYLNLSHTNVEDVWQIQNLHNIKYLYTDLNDIK